jgi:hypothetical protein
LAEKYPDSAAANQGKSLLAKLKDTPAVPPYAGTSDPEENAGNPTAGLSSIPDMLSASRLPSFGSRSSNALNQTFTTCRLGAWC